MGIQTFRKREACMSVQASSVVAHGQNEWAPLAKEPLLAAILRLSLGVVFTVAALSKILQPYAFLSSVYSYGALDDVSGLWVARILPWLELVIGIALIRRIALPGASLLAALLGIVFVAVKSHAIHEDIQIGCGCVVNSNGGVVGVGDLLFSVAVFVVASVGLFRSSCNRR